MRKRGWLDNLNALGGRQLPHQQPSSGNSPEVWHTACGFFLPYCLDVEILMRASLMRLEGGAVAMTSCSLHSIVFSHTTAKVSISRVVRNHIPEEVHVCDSYCTRRWWRPCLSRRVSYLSARPGMHEGGEVFCSRGTHTRPSPPLISILPISFEIGPSILLGINRRAKKCLLIFRS